MASLTRGEAAARAALLAVSRYDVHLDLTGLRAGTTLRASTTVILDAASAGETFVDVVADEAHARLDGVPLAADAFDGERITFALTPGRHELVVESRTDRTEQRAGLHRSIDAGDGEAYVWTSFEPDDARRVFACFDQPDLKATFGFTVLAPSEWVVASNSPTAAAPQPRGEARMWRFDDTVTLSTYLTVVCAGPFHEVRRTVDGYDLGWLARRSLAGPLTEQADELFALTAAGLRYFGEQFAMPFPQRTYTQVFCPDFQGAMENWGCVTWMDSFLFRSAPTTFEREMRAVILLHEMAHMWFGDIVTMRWWDDLWLNESFADWAAVWASAHCSEFTDAWVTFLGGRKEAGYSADAAPSTHPIRQDVASGEAAKAAFDMVTYAKGASVLRQLTAYAGEDDFVAGLRSYFAAHAWGNATVADLLGAVGAASGRDLHAWAREWLLTAGTDVLATHAELSADGAHYTGLDVVVTPPAAHPANRPHRVKIGVYDLDGDRLALREDVEFDAVGARTPVPEVIGRPVADLLLLNDDDLTFARVRPDSRSLATLLAAGETLPTALARGVARLTLWHLVDDGLLAAPDLVAFLRRGLLAETSAAGREGMLRTAVAAVQDWTPPGRVAQIGDGLAETLLELVDRAAAAGDEAGRLSALQAAIAVARSPQRLADLEPLADSVDLRWRWAAAAAATGHADDATTAALIEADPDPDAVHRAWVVRAARPGAAAKEEAWQALVVDRRVPLTVLPAAGRAFWEPTHTGVLPPFADAFVEALPSLGDAGMTAIMIMVASMLPRHGIDAAFLARLTEAADAPGLSPIVAVQVRERAATLGRMLRARALG